MKALKGKKKWVMLNEIYVSYATIPSWFKVIAKAAIGRLSFFESPEEPLSNITSLRLEMKRAGLPSHVALAEGDHFGTAVKKKAFRGECVQHASAMLAETEDKIADVHFSLLQDLLSCPRFRKKTA